MKRYRIKITIAEQETPEKSVSVYLENVASDDILLTLMDAPIGLALKGLEKK